MTQEITYEQAFARLEQILEAINSGKTSLEESLKFYEEAEKLIRFCTVSLNAAEQKIEQLIKTRNGELLLNANGKPQTEGFAR